MKNLLISVFTLLAISFIATSMVPVNNNSTVDKVTICHYVGDEGEGPKKGCEMFFKIEISEHAIGGHLRHGDHIHGSMKCKTMQNH